MNYKLFLFFAILLAMNIQSAKAAYLKNPPPLPKRPGEVPALPPRRGAVQPPPTQPLAPPPLPARPPLPPRKGEVQQPQLKDVAKANDDVIKAMEDVIVKTLKKGSVFYRTFF